MNDSPDTVSPVTDRPWSLRLAMILLSAQAGGLGLLGGWLLVLSVTSPQTSAGAGIAEALVAFGIAALLITAVVSLSRGNPGMRGIAIFIELMTLPLGYYLASAGLWAAAIIAWVIGVGTAALLVSPMVRQATGVH